MNSNRQASLHKNLRLRADIIVAVRQFFAAEGYLEVETPIRIPAPTPESYIEAHESEGWYLQTSPELCMKRLLASGYAKIFQICKCFRKKERGKKHLPEFTMIEWYCADSNYIEMMAFCEELIRFAVNNICHEDHIFYQGKTIDFSGTWQRLSVVEAFDRYASIPMNKAIEQDRFDEIMGIEIEPCLGFGNPLFLYDYPISSGALARVKPENSLFTERFELYIAGMEICNAFTELTDSKEMRKRFEEELRRKKETGNNASPVPERFLASMEYMPEASGNALGIDRLVMLFADVANIDDVVAFTQEEL